MKKSVFCLLAVAILLLNSTHLPAEETGKVLSLTLGKSIEIALKNNAEILIKSEELKGCAAVIKKARAHLLPQLSVNADYYNYHDHPYITYEENYQTNVTLTQTLYAGSRLINSLRQSKLKLKAAGEQEQRTHHEIIFRVKSALHKILLGKESVRINQETLSLAEEQLRIAKDRYNAGEVSNYDVLRAEVEVAGIKPELVKAENYLEVSQNQFKFILGLDLATQVELKGNFDYLPWEVNPDSVMDTAFTMRPELKEAETSEKISELGVRIARGGSRPTVSLIVGNYWDEKSPFYTGEEWDDYYVGLISVKIPVFDGLESRAMVQSAVTQLNAVKISRKNLKERVKLEVKNAILNLKAAGEIVLSQSRNVEKAEEGLKIMQARYKNGKATQLDLLDAQVTLSRTKVNYAESIYDHILAKASLKLAIGLT